MNSKKILITGACGFIGMNLAVHLSNNGYQVVAIDHLQPAYGGDLSKMRKGVLEQTYDVRVFTIDVRDYSSIRALLETSSSFDVIVHLAAWPGVRLSHENPDDYHKANVDGFGNILELVRVTKPEKFLFASSSSVYGDLGKAGPVKEQDATGKNLKSFYAATKWANEVLAAQHHKISGVPTLALRFFTVFGEYGRPDMAYWSFLQKMYSGLPVQLYGKTGGKRNFSYISDVVSILKRIIESPLTDYQEINIASGDPIHTIDYLELLARYSGQKPNIKVVERPLTDVETTWSDQGKLISMIGHVPHTHIEKSVENFVRWYQTKMNI